MPINDNDNFLAGKCPICLKSPPCLCAFTDQEGQLSIVSDPSLPQGLMLNVLVDIKNELAAIKMLLQTKSLKDDLNAILKVHN